MAGKVNLLLNNPKNIVHGYLNLDPFADGNDVRVKTDIIDLGEYIDDSECSEIRAEEVLCYFSAELAEKMLTNWVDKLRKNGTISIIDCDLRLISKAILTDVLDLNNANIMLFGLQNSEYTFKKMILDLPTIEILLMKKGLKIVEKSLDKFHFIIKAQRVN